MTAREEWERLSAHLARRLVDVGYWWLMIWLFVPVIDHLAAGIRAIVHR